MQLNVVHLLEELDAVVARLAQQGGQVAVPAAVPALGEGLGRGADHAQAALLHQRRGRVEAAARAREHHGAQHRVQRRREAPRPPFGAGLGGRGGADELRERGGGGDAHGDFLVAEEVEAAERDGGERGDRGRHVRGEQLLPGRLRAGEVRVAEHVRPGEVPCRHAVLRAAERVQRGEDAVEVPLRDHVLRVPRAEVRHHPRGGAEAVAAAAERRRGEGLREELAHPRLRLAGHAAARGAERPRQRAQVPQRVGQRGQQAQVAAQHVLPRRVVPQARLGPRTERRQQVRQQQRHQKVLRAGGALQQPVPRGSLAHLAQDAQLHGADVSLALRLAAAADALADALQQPRQERLQQRPRRHRVPVEEHLQRAEDAADDARRARRGDGVHGAREKVGVRGEPRHQILVRREDAKEAEQRRLPRRAAGGGRERLEARGQRGERRPKVRGEIEAPGELLREVAEPADAERADRARARGRPRARLRGRRPGTACAAVAVGAAVCVVVAVIVAVVVAVRVAVSGGAGRLTGPQRRRDDAEEGRHEAQQLEAELGYDISEEVQEALQLLRLRGEGVKVLGRRRLGPAHHALRGAAHRQRPQHEAGEGDELVLLELREPAEDRGAAHGGRLLLGPHARGPGGEAAEEEGDERLEQLPALVVAVQQRALRVLRAGDADAHGRKRFAHPARVLQ